MWSWIAAWGCAILLQYNSVNINIEHFTVFDQVPVYEGDGTNYLYTHFTVEVVGTIHFDTVTRTLLGSGGSGGDVPIINPDTGQPATTAAQIIAAIRTRLLRKQQLLQISIDHGQWDPNTQQTFNPTPVTDVKIVSNVPFTSSLILESPMVVNVGGILPTRMPCDLRFGPNPIAFNVLSFIGEKTAIVKFAIETWIDDCPTVNFMTTHTWSMTHEWDEDYYTTRTIEGRVVFRRDWLETLFDQNGAVVASRPFAPDYFRSKFFHPLPNNMKRTASINALEDGCTVEYTITDEEQPMNINPSYQITRIKGEYWRTSGLAPRFAWLPTGIPEDEAGVTFEAWGNRNASRNSLVKALVQMCSWWNLYPVSFVANQQPSGIANHFDLHVDAVNKYARLTSVQSASGLTSLSQANTSKFSVPVDRGPRFAIAGPGEQTFDGWPEDIINPDNQQYIATTATMQNVNAPNDNGTRGTYLEALVASALEIAPCQGAPTPGPQPVPPAFA